MKFHWDSKARFGDVNALRIGGVLSIKVFAYIDSN
jgi:hypothetical protein